MLDCWTGDAVFTSVAEFTMTYLDITVGGGKLTTMLQSKVDSIMATPEDDIPQDKTRLESLAARLFGCIPDLTEQAVAMDLQSQSALEAAGKRHQPEGGGAS